MTDVRRAQRLRELLARVQANAARTVPGRPLRPALTAWPTDEAYTSFPDNRATSAPPPANAEEMRAFAEASLGQRFQAEDRWTSLLTGNVENAPRMPPPPALPSPPPVSLPVDERPGSEPPRRTVEDPPSSAGHRGLGGKLRRARGKSRSSAPSQCRHRHPRPCRAILLRAHLSGPSRRSRRSAPSRSGSARRSGATLSKTFASVVRRCVRSRGCRKSRRLGRRRARWRSCRRHPRQPDRFGENDRAEAFGPPSLGYGRLGRRRWRTGATRRAPERRAAGWLGWGLAAAGAAGVAVASFVLIPRFLSGSPTRDVAVEANASSAWPRLPAAPSFATTSMSEVTLPGGRPSPSATPSGDASAAPPDASQLPSNYGYVNFVSDRELHVYVNGKLAGETGQWLRVECDYRNVRFSERTLPKIGSSFPAWTGEGHTVVLPCREATRLTVPSDGRSAPPTDSSPH